MEKALALLGVLGLTVCVYGWRYLMFVMWEDPGVIQGEGVPQEVSHGLGGRAPKSGQLLLL